MRKAAMVACATLLGLLPAWAPAQARKAPDSAALAKGRLTYQRYCVSCHGATAKGDGPLASELRAAVPDLTSLAARNGGQFPRERVVKMVENGGTVPAHGTADMPAWGDAFKKTRGTEEATIAAAIENLADYLGSVQQLAKVK